MENRQQARDGGINGSPILLSICCSKVLNVGQSHEIAREIDAVGGSLNAFTGKEYTCLYARVLRRDMLLGLDIICDMYKHSLFREDDIEHEKQVVTQEIKWSQDNPEEYIFEMFNSSYYRDQPLGCPSSVR